ncbi:MAG: hypothetical protein DWQ36_13465, partial [Acidobacteria bacterium]
MIETRVCKVGDPQSDDCSSALSAVLTTVQARNLYGDLEVVTLPAGNVREYAYDAAGRVETMDTQPDAATEAERVHYEYDVAGQRTDEIHQEWTGSQYEDRSHTRWEYDGCRLESMIQGFGSASPSVTEYAYDCGGRLDSVWAPDNPSQGQTSTPSSIYAYDELDRLETVMNPWGGAGGPSLITTSYGYDVQDHLTSVTDAE